MAKFQPGQSGNPKGRPPKDRALTAILERAGAHTIEIDGEKLSGRRLLARYVWEGITTGSVTFPGGQKMVLSPQDWKDFVKWVYTHIDGPPKTQMELTGKDGGAVTIKIVDATDDGNNDHPASTAPDASDDAETGETL